MCSETDRDEAGRPYSGTAILSCWPPGERKLAPCMDKVRYQAAAVHRPGMRPFLLVNHYGHPKDAAKRAYDAEQAVQWLVAAGEDFLWVGDWNATPEEQPAAKWQTCGTLRACDDVASSEVRPTREDGKRVIDYGMYGGDIHVTDRGQHKGMADHHLVTYTLECGALEETRAWQLRRKVQDGTEEVSPEDWESDVWPKYRERYELAKRTRDTSDMWRCLSNAAEDALCEVDDRGVPRAQVKRPVLKPKQCTKTERLQGVWERRLRRLARRIRE